MKMMHQIDGVRIDVATKISKTFTLEFPGRRVDGHPVLGQVALSKGSHVKLIISEECVTAKTPPYELVKLLADTFHVTDPKDFTLLNLALSDVSADSILSVFNQHGIRVDGLTLGKLRRSLTVASFRQMLTSGWHREH